MYSWGSAFSPWSLFALFWHQNFFQVGKQLFLYTSEKELFRARKEFDLCCPLLSPHHCVHSQRPRRCGVLQVSNPQKMLLIKADDEIGSLSYPYLTLLSSLVSCAAHFSFKLDQSLRSLIISSITDSRNLTILLGRLKIYSQSKQ